MFSTVLVRQPKASAICLSVQLGPSASAFSRICARRTFCDDPLSRLITSRSVSRSSSVRRTIYFFNIAITLLGYRTSLNNQPDDTTLKVTPDKALATAPKNPQMLARPNQQGARRAPANSAFIKQRFNQPAGKLPVPAAIELHDVVKQREYRLQRGRHVSQGGSGKNVVDRAHLVLIDNAFAD